MWRERTLLEHWRIVYLDGVHFSIRHGDKADSTIILTALGVDLAGNKEVLALRACAEESKDGWVCLLQDLRRRGTTQIDLIVTDGHDGLLAAVADLFTATPRQRCLVHKQRNILNAIPRRERGDVQPELVGILDQPTKQEALLQLAAFKAKYGKRYPEAVRSLAEDEEHLLTFYEFPQSMHWHIQTTNVIESLFSNVRQRTDQIDVFTRRVQLSSNRLGHDAGYPFAQNLSVAFLRTDHCCSRKQPAGMDGLGRGSFFAPRVARLPRTDVDGDLCSRKEVERGLPFIPRWSMLSREKKHMFAPFSQVKSRKESDHDHKWSFAADGIQRVGRVSDQPSAGHRPAFA